MPLFLGTRLWNLQLINGDKYKKLSKENRIHLIPISGVRGLIYDTKNSILAKNLISYNLVIIPDNQKTTQKILQKISSTIGIPYRMLLTNFKINRNKTRFVAIKIYSNLTWKQLVLVEAYQEEFPGVSVDISQIRYYNLLFCMLLNQILLQRNEKLLFCDKFKNSHSNLTWKQLVLVEAKSRRISRNLLLVSDTIPTRII